MRHRKSVLKLNRTSSHRKAMFRNMVTSLFKHEKIQTTGAKAKEVRRWADHLITLAKQGDLHARRQALAIVREKDVVHKLFEQAAERFGSVSGGYTRIVKLGYRPGDAAPVSLVELVYSQDTKKKKKAKKKKVKAEKAAPKAAVPATAGGKKSKPEKSKAPAADPKEAAEVKAETAGKKEPAAETEKAAAKPTAKKTSKKEAAGDEEKEKSVTKAAPKKKSAATDKPAEAEKEGEPEEETKGATEIKAKPAEKEAAADTKDKPVPAENTTEEDEK